MNNIIQFRTTNGARRVASGDRGAAQILFFTGVRYQRWSEDTQAQPQEPSSRRKRERVQICETGRGRKSQR
jgi:hypothetical protein